MSERTKASEEDARAGAVEEGAAVGFACGPNGCRHVAIPAEEFAEIIAAADETKRRRSEEMPDTGAALAVLHRAYTRLGELGWRHAMYAPRDGSSFECIEAGSIGIHTAHVTMLKYEQPAVWIEADGDLWPSHPILFRVPLPHHDGNTNPEATRHD